MAATHEAGLHRDITGNKALNQRIFFSHSGLISDSLTSTTPEPLTSSAINDDIIFAANAVLTLRQKSDVNLHGRLLACVAAGLSESLGIPCFERHAKIDEEVPILDVFKDVCDNYVLLRWKIKNPDEFEKNEELEAYIHTTQADYSLKIPTYQELQGKKILEKKDILIDHLEPAFA